MPLFDERKKFFECSVPFLPASVNKVINAARYHQKDRKVKSDQTAMVLLFRNAYRRKPKYLGCVALKYTLYSKNNRCFDIDNRVKTMQDCLAPAGIIADDRQIIAMQVERVLHKGADSCKVELYMTTMREVKE